MLENLEKLNTPEKETSIYDLVVASIEKILKDMPESQNAKSYLIENLGKEYGQDLAEKIVDSLSDTFIIETKIKLGKIKETKVKNNKTNDTKRLKTITGIGAVAVPIIGAAVILNPFDKNKEENKTTDKKLPPQGISAPGKKSTNEEKNINFNERFKGEIYNSLPEKEKDIYKYFAEKNPTPNRGYQILDKKSAIMYIFNSNNEIIAKILTGFGKDTGDEPNTSTKYNEGKMTTPAGIYLLSNSIDEGDIEEYGKLQYSMYGVSILGDRVFLGQHQTYSKHGELEPRTEKLNSKNPNDNNFSNGCLNNKQEDIEKYIKPYFKGDNSELVFILQDEQSEKSGATFDVEILVKKIFPLMLEMANQEEKIYEESISKIKDTINKEWEEIAKLQNEENELMIKYNKNKENTSVQEKINEIKNIIKEKRGIIGKNRGELTVYDAKIIALGVKRKGIEEILVMNN